MHSGICGTLENQILCNLIIISREVLQSAAFNIKQVLATATDQDRNITHGPEFGGNKLGLNELLLNNRKFLD
jgi:hypothetical protein